jgi:hypothetical protein
MKKIKLSCMLFTVIGVMSFMSLEHQSNIDEANAWVAAAYVISENTDANNTELAALSAFGTVHGATQGAIYGFMFGGPVGFLVGVSVGL